MKLTNYITCLVSIIIIFTACKKEDNTTNTEPLSQNTPLSLSGTINGQQMPDFGVKAASVLIDTINSDSVSVRFSLLFIIDSISSTTHFSIGLGGMQIKNTDIGNSEPFLNYFKTGDDIFTYGSLATITKPHKVFIQFFDNNFSMWSSTVDPINNIFALTEVYSYTLNGDKDYVKFRLRAKGILQNNSTAVTIPFDIAIIGRAQNPEP